MHVPPLCDARVCVCVCVCATTTAPPPSSNADKLEAEGEGVEGEERLKLAEEADELQGLLPDLDSKVGRGCGLTCVNGNVI